MSRMYQKLLMLPLIIALIQLQIFTAAFTPTLANKFNLFSGNENRVNAKVIRRLKDKKTAMDRAREMLRNRQSYKFQVL